ncbi:helix-hairpin-helix domain-containing protein [Patescibacteria group bacterium]
MPDDSSSKDSFLEGKTTSFSEFVYGNRINIFLIFLGLILLGSGVLIYINSRENNDIEIIESVDEDSVNQEIIVEIAGSVEKPGVYNMPNLSRVEDLLIISGGLSADADRSWVEKYINRAAKLTDGQKFYIPKENEQSDSTSANNLSRESGGILGESDNQNNPVNINTASQKELEGLPGIGPVYAQNIIEQRPYSSVEELLSKDALKSFVYEKIKELVTVY